MKVLLVWLLREILDRSNASNDGMLDRDASPALNSCWSLRGILLERVRLGLVGSPSLSGAMNLANKKYQIVER